MWLIDQLVEKHIADALENGEFDNLPGKGKKLVLDDDSHVPEELRVGYRLLKNSGFLPPEIELRKQALKLHDMLLNLEDGSSRRDEHVKQLILMEYRLQQLGASTDFLHGPWRKHIVHKITGGE